MRTRWVQATSRPLASCSAPLWKLRRPLAAMAASIARIWAASVFSAFQRQVAGRGVDVQAAVQVGDVGDDVLGVVPRHRTIR